MPVSSGLRRQHDDERTLIAGRPPVAVGSRKVDEWGRTPQGLFSLAWGEASHKRESKQRNRRTNAREQTLTHRQDRPVESGRLAANAATVREKQPLTTTNDAAAYPGGVSAERSEPPKAGASAVRIAANAAKANRSATLMAGWAKPEWGRWGGEQHR